MAHRSRAAAMCAAMLVFGAIALSGGPAVAAKKTKVTVAVAKVSGVGTVLVDARGHTLYTLTDANGQAVACTGQCAAAWPPLTVSARSKAKGAKGVKSLGTTATGQVTAGGLPLHRFVGDTAAKEAKGEGIASFGGTWHVVKVTTAKSGAKTTSTTKGKTSGYSGY